MEAKDVFRDFENEAVQDDADFGWRSFFRFFGLDSSSVYEIDYRNPILSRILLFLRI